MNTNPVPGIDKSKIDFCIDNLELNEPAFKPMADEARAEVKATFESHAQQAARIEELEAALELTNRVLDSSLLIMRMDTEYETMIEPRVRQNRAALAKGKTS